jgi:LAO/AO transport system kinase
VTSERTRKKTPGGPTRKAGNLLTPDLWDRFFRGDRPACARLITLVENHPRLVPAIRDRLLPRQKGGVRIGITGPPGVGKSTVTAALARRTIAAGHGVGIIAVDPTSPFSGGAFLGDRVRMHGLGEDARLFIRSQASRNGHGGLSPATPYAADVLDAFGLDRIFIETVGVGQAELDVLTCADLILLVIQPGTGDVIQTLKAGILEIADIILVNKADLPGADLLLDSLKFLFEINLRRTAKPLPSVLTASAIQDRGLDEVQAEVERRIRGLTESGELHEKKRQRLERDIRSAIRDHLWDRFSALTGAPEEIRAVAGRLLENRQSPYPYLRRTCSRVRIEFAKERAKRDHQEQKKLGRRAPKVRAAGR